MHKSWMWKLGALGFVTVASATMVAGCSDDDDLGPQAPPATQQCGATVLSMSGQACITDGQICSVPINCVSGEHQVSTCTCSGGSFLCVGPARDDEGNLAPVGNEEPACQELPQTDPPTCESSADQLNGQACDKIHRSCRFPSAETCAGQTTGQYDTCDCHQVGGDNALKWVCTKNNCGDGGIFVPPDSGTSSSSSGGTDAGDDAGDDI